MVVMGSYVGFKERSVVILFNVLRGCSGCCGKQTAATKKQRDQLSYCNHLGEK